MLILKNAYILTGEKGSEIRKGSIVIEKDIIKDVIYHDLENPDPSYQVIDLDGLYLGPGFIDVHSHSDLTIFCHPESESALSQGVTTIISGNCGFSVCPANKTKKEILKEASAYGITNIPWKTINEYFKHLENTQIGINFGYLVGHGQIRAEVVGYSNIKITEDHLKQMSYELEKALDDGAVGLSLGLIYIPGRFASMDELVQLAKIVKSKNKIVTNHMRSESSHLIEAIEESIEISQRTGVNFQISHLKAAGVGKGKAQSACHLIEKAIEKGINVAADQYPYNASNTGLSQVLPPHYLEGSIDQIIKKVTQNPENIAQEIEKYPHTPWDQIIISEAYNPKLTKYLGMSIKQIAQDMRLPEAMTVLKLLEIENYDLGAIYFLMDQQEVDYIACQNFVMVASDSAVRNTNSPSFPHPRTFGTYTKFISYYVKERELLTLSEAIHKMTLMPATKFNIPKRGKIQKGYFADIVVFNLEKVKDNATYTSPKNLSDGVEMVFVNGVLSYKDKRVINKSGKVLRL
ncbi:MAG: amidohydrolase family protein [bacterium]